MSDTDKEALNLARKIITIHEDDRRFPYMCTADKLTIGIGRNLSDVGISPDESQFLFANDMKRVVAFLETKPYWRELSVRRKAALMDMAFCLGPSRFNKFVSMHAALVGKDYNSAAEQILKSKFAKQTGKRADDLAALMREEARFG